MYDEKRVWIPAEPVIPNDKYDFIIRLGLKAFAKDCGLTIVWDTDNFEAWKERVIKWADVPDDWSREQYRKAVEPLMPELYEDALESQRQLRDFIANRAEREAAERERAEHEAAERISKDKEADDD